MRCGCSKQLIDGQLVEFGLELSSQICTIDLGDSVYTCSGAHGGHGRCHFQES